MTPFGKKPAASSAPTSPPSAPYGGNAPAGKARKRITQRLVLGGKGAETGEINTGGGGLKIPGAPSPVVSQVIPTSPYEGSVDVPLVNLLGYIPAEFVTMEHDALYQSEYAAQPVSLPLGVILPMLPSGKIEILAQDLYGYVPDGVMKTPEELGDYALSPVSLPLQEIISRIPPEAMILRSDQKQIDASVTQMDDPFSAEMLAAAAQEVAQQEQEAPFDVNQVDEPASPSDPSPDEAVAEPEYPQEAQEPFSAPGEEMASDPTPAPGSVPGGGEEPDLSFTQSEEYRKWLEQMEQEESSESSPAEAEQNELSDGEVFEAQPALEASFEQQASYGPEEESPEGAEPPLTESAGSEEFSDMETGEMADEMDLTAPIPHEETPEHASTEPAASPSDAVSDPTPPPALEAEEDLADNPLFAPTRIVPKVPSKPASAKRAAEAKEQPKPHVQPVPKSRKQPVAAVAKPPSPKPKPVPKVSKQPDSGLFKSPAPAPPKPQVSASAVSDSPGAFKVPLPPKASAPQKPSFSFKPKSPAPGFEKETQEVPSPADSDEELVVSARMGQLLGIRDNPSPSLKEIVRQINCWPGMRGCIVGGKDGLRISSDVADDSFANSISAFAPKLIDRISELFNDLGFSEVEELHTPIEDSSVYIFRKNDLYLIILFEDASFPESYRLLVKQVLEELNINKKIRS